jgi:hypothetical protein
MVDFRPGCMNMVLAQDIKICTVLNKHVKYSKQPQQLKEAYRYTKQYVPNPRIPRLPWHLPQQLLKKIKNTHLYTTNNGS